MRPLTVLAGVCALLAAFVVVVDYRDGDLSSRAHVMGTVLLVLAALCLDSAPIERALTAIMQMLARKRGGT